MAQLTHYYMMRTNSPGPFAGLQTLIISLLSIMWFPVMSTTIGYEKKKGLLQMMKIQSLETWIYWVSNYAWFFFLYSSVLVIYFYLWQEYVEYKYDYVQLAVVHILWGNAQIGCAFVISALFYKAESLTGVTYFFMVWTIMAMVVFRDMIDPPWTHNAYPLVVFPPTNY